MKRRFLQDPILIIGTIISLIVSIILYISDPNKIETSLLIGLNGILISLLLDLITRIIELGNKLLKTLRLTDRLGKDPWFYEQIMDIVQAWERINSFEDHSLFISLARSLLTDTSEKMVEISSGEIVGDASEYRLLLLIAESAKKTIMATSYVATDWWESPGGQNYWKANLEALNRGVTITRIFIYDDNNFDAVNILAEKMGKQGIIIRIINRQNLPENLHVDLVISDDKLIWTTQFSPEKHFQEHHVSFRPEAIQRGLSKFEKIKLLSKGFTSKEVEK